jgi:hypothetical protein
MFDLYLRLGGNISYTDHKHNRNFLQRYLVMSKEINSDFVRHLILESEDLSHCDNRGENILAYLARNESSSSSIYTFLPKAEVKKLVTSKLLFYYI